MRSGWLRRLLGGGQLPEGFDGRLDGEERVLASAAAAGGGHLVVTTLGLWLPDHDEPSPDDLRHRRIGWHLVSKATWDGRALTVVEADEVGTEGEAVIIVDRAPLRLVLPEPGPVPEQVHSRVTRSVLHSERDAAGTVTVRRQVPGRDGVQLQIRRATG